MASVDAAQDDLFHSIVMSEEGSWREGFQDGVEMGKKNAYEEGFQLGVSKGLEIGREVGFYAGYAFHVSKVLSEEKSKDRAFKVCDAILRLADTFIDIDPTDEGLTENLSKIQAKFKQLTSLLGIQMEYIAVEGGSDAQGSTF